MYHVCFAQKNAKGKQLPGSHPVRDPVGLRPVREPAGSRPARDPARSPAWDRKPVAHRFVDSSGFCRHPEGPPEPAEGPVEVHPELVEGSTR
jgi:hypothetical protein